MPDKRIIWQPAGLYGAGYNFEIILDRIFAEEMLSVKTCSDTRLKMNALAKSFVPANFNPHLQFYLNTAMVSQFDLGAGGKWLALRETYGKNPLEVFNSVIKYTSHNIDASKEAIDLMKLVDFWVEYSDMLKEIDKELR